MIINLYKFVVAVIPIHLITKEALQDHFCFFENFICLNLETLSRFIVNLVSFILQIQECSLFDLLGFLNRGSPYLEIFLCCTVHFSAFHFLFLKNLEIAYLFAPSKIINFLHCCLFSESNF